MSDELSAAFLADLRRQGMGEEFLPGFSQYVDAFRRANQSVSPQDLSDAHVQAVVAELGREGASERDVRNTKVALTAFLDFLKTRRTDPGTSPRAPGSPGHRSPTQAAAPSSRYEPPTGGAAGDAVPMWEMFRRPWSAAGAAASAGIAIPILFGALPGRLSLLALIYYPGLVAYYFLTLDHVGRGNGGLPTINPLEADTLFPNAWKGLACALAMSSPLIVAFIIAPGMVSDPGDHVLTLLVCGTLGILLGPPVILGVYVSGSTMTAFHPGAWVKIIRTFPKDYGEAALGFFLVAIPIVVLELVPIPIDSGPGVLLEYVLVFATNFMWLAQACMLGEFARRNAVSLGGAG